MKKILTNTLKAYKNNPKFIFLFIIEYAIFSLFAFNSLIQFPNLLTEYAFLIFSGIIFLLINSLFLSLFIGGSHLALKNKFSFKETLKFSKYTLKNLTIIIFLAILGAIFFFIAKLTADNLVNKISGTWIFTIAILIFFIGVFVLTLFTFANFFCTLENKGPIQSLIKSIKTTKKIYFKLFLILAGYLILDYLISKINYILAQDLIHYIILYPILVLALTALFENVSNK